MELPHSSRCAYSTDLGAMYVGDAQAVLASEDLSDLKGQVQLVLTSPPFPLIKKKSYGNQDHDRYLSWLADFAPLLGDFLCPNGSIVIELGNAWTPGKPTMSTLGLKSLLSFLESGNLELCQQFIWHNTAKLPTPAQWVSIERTRVKDSFTHIWWMSRTDRPKANNRNVLTQYSPSMTRLLETKQYNAGGRPSAHKIGKTSFLRNNGGAIPANVLIHPNTSASDPYLAHCKANGIIPHPARMPAAIADFFVRFLTDAGDLVLDPFAGSNTTGAVAESLGRQWAAVELDQEFADASQARFTNPQTALPDAA